MFLPFIANTDHDRDEMLKTIGISCVSDLFVDIPENLRLQGELRLPPPLAELDLMRRSGELAHGNDTASDHACFLGAGCYDHFVPSVVRHIASRSEFLTAYTPYQAEASQGTLQVIYEFQTMISELTGMEIANASLYDGASGVAEAVLMATAITRRNRILLSRALHPSYRQVVRAYCQGLPLIIDEIPCEQGATRADLLRSMMNDDTAAVVIQQPNFLGCIEETRALEGVIHDSGALYISVVNPISLGILEPPGAYDADIVVGEGQPLGIPMSLGGPGVGIFACKKKFARSAPGRMVGATTEESCEGRRGFVLTLETREQHIRREKATSNICTNQGLLMLTATIYLTTLGPGGLKQVANLCLQKAHYASRCIAELQGFEVPFQAPFFHEFVVRCPSSVAEMNRKLMSQGIIGGYDLGVDYPELENCMLLCVTEKRTKEEIDRLVAQIAS